MSFTVCPVSIPCLDKGVGRQEREGQKDGRNGHPKGIRTTEASLPS